MFQIMLRTFKKVDLYDLSKSSKLKKKAHSLLLQQGKPMLRGVFNFGSEKDECFASVEYLIVSKVMERQLSSAL